MPSAAFDNALAYRANRMMASEEDLNGKYGRKWADLKKRSKDSFWQYALACITAGTFFLPNDSKAYSDFLDDVADIVNENPMAFKAAFRTLFPREVTKNDSFDRTLLEEAVAEDFVRADDLLYPVREKVEEIYDQLYFQSHCFYNQAGVCSNPLIGDGVGGIWDESSEAWIIHNGNFVSYDYRFRPIA
ncbi:MAG: hypothetical protein Q4B26_01500 [Eubacteriales bacterium]|nr:hypothetical protein [Eubacteriales bacterium]